MPRFLLPLLSVLLFTTLVFGGCSSPSSEGFAIYLTKGDIPVTQMEALSHFDLADTPLISINDIVSYDKNLHRIELTAEAGARVRQLNIPVNGKSFVICVDKQPIYWGAFWTPISSISFDGIAIWADYVAEMQNVIYLTLGYPDPICFKGDDPRPNPLILESLEKAGKLK